ncbi:unnamed protein product [Schistocephalus solidus]|uniref:C2H2-type domain-containing protein n=1 Tax=Schistocephalus solidus TaxID=70667 RepID=A0A183SM65_SCHSO|nr:unnamed protein product [Schistocephalus solidus]
MRPNGSPPPRPKERARKSTAPLTNIVDAQALLTCPRCQRIFCARIGLDEHLRTQCINNQKITISTSNSANPPSDSPTLTPGINSITPTIIETTSQCSARVAHTTTTTATTTTSIIDGDALLNCPQGNRTFTSRIGLVGHLRFHYTETGEPVLGAPTDSRDHSLHCPQCPCAFTHCMGLFGQRNSPQCRQHRYPIHTLHSSHSYRHRHPNSMNDIPSQPLPIFPAHTAPANSTHASA